MRRRVTRRLSIPRPNLFFRSTRAKCGLCQTQPLNSRSHRLTHNANVRASKSLTLKQYYRSPRSPT